MQNKIFECTNENCTIFKQNNQFKHESCNNCPFKKIDLSVAISSNPIKVPDNSSNYLDDRIKVNNVDELKEVDKLHEVTSVIKVNNVNHPGEVNFEQTRVLSKYRFEKVALSVILVVITIILAIQFMLK